MTNSTSKKALEVKKALLSKSTWIKHRYGPLVKWVRKNKNFFQRINQNQTKA